jgi:RHS repeat-associated protein
VLGYGHVNELRSYNNRLQPTSLLTQLPGPDTALWMGYNFTDAQGRNNGNVMAWMSAGKQLFNRSYGYDELNRLASVTTSGEACAGLTWSYDIWGNRTNQSGSGGPCSEHHPTVLTNNRIQELGYDAAGNVTSDPATSASYTFDAENRMVASNSTLGNATYVYDANGQRVQKTVDGVVTEFVYDAGGAVAAERQAGAWTKGYVMAGGMLALYDNTVTPATTYFAHADHLGSTRLLTRLDGTVAECDDYLPFGELNAGTCLPPAGTTTTTHKFTGKERDVESGFDYFGARYHSSGYGRFTSVDPEFGRLPNPQSLNRYAYVFNDPLYYVDPDGRDPIGASLLDRILNYERYVSARFDRFMYPPPRPPSPYPTIGPALPLPERDLVQQRNFARGPRSLFNDGPRIARDNIERQIAEAVRKDILIDVVRWIIDPMTSLDDLHAARSRIQGDPSNVHPLVDRIPFVGEAIGKIVDYVEDANSMSRTAMLQDEIVDLLTKAIRKKEAEEKDCHKSPMRCDTPK